MTAKWIADAVRCPRFILARMLIAFFCPRQSPKEVYALHKVTLHPVMRPTHFLTIPLTCQGYLNKWVM